MNERFITHSFALILPRALIAWNLLTQKLIRLPSMQSLKQAVNIAHLITL